MGAIEIRWCPRDEPLPAAAVVGLGPVARALGRILHARPLLRTHAEVVAGPELLCLLAPTELLPWVDGVVYLGREPATPELYLPTISVPDPAPELLLRACIRAGHTAPLCVLPDPRSIISLARARPADPATLDAWLHEAPR